MYLEYGMDLAQSVVVFVAGFVFIISAISPCTTVLYENNNNNTGITGTTSAI